MTARRRYDQHRVAVEEPDRLEMENAEDLLNTHPRGVGASGLRF
jgi:hypothetical protein